jgi:hypothetical protein
MSGALRDAQGFAALKRSSIVSAGLERAKSNSIDTIIATPCARIFDGHGSSALPGDVAVFFLAIFQSSGWIEI